MLNRLPEIRITFCFSALVPSSFVNMPVLSLAQLALSKIPYFQVSTMSLQQKTVLHYELYPIIHFPRGMCQTPLYELCDCVHFGRCLCYLGLYKSEMISCWWGEESDFHFLIGWLPLSFQHNS